MFLRDYFPAVEPTVLLYLAGMMILGLCWLTALAINLRRDERKERESRDRWSAAVEEQNRLRAEEKKRRAS
jgi:hypothetical protein